MSKLSEQPSRWNALLPTAEHELVESELVESGKEYVAELIELVKKTGKASVGYKQFTR